MVGACQDSGAWVAHRGVEAHTEVGVAPLGGVVCHQADTETAGTAGTEETVTVVDVPADTQSVKATLITAETTIHTPGTPLPETTSQGKGMCCPGFDFPKGPGAYAPRFCCRFISLGAQNGVKT